MKMTFFLFNFQRVWNTVKCRGKIREESGNFEVDDKWQPCLLFHVIVDEDIPNLLIFNLNPKLSFYRA